ncbi:MAG TPA: hypothetical protein VHQ03_10180, partial [Candidatus Dormibacteraeota bacterium]|nr:hypothetical protein [Candidatus Dormibacteraeota bacterium]
KRVGNLPAELTSFVGRRRELAEIKRLLMTTRLLTLTGAGGAGRPGLRFGRPTRWRATSPTAPGWWRWRRSAILFS